MGFTLKKAGSPLPRGAHGVIIGSAGQQPACICGDRDGAAIETVAVYVFSATGRTRAMRSGRSFVLSLVLVAAASSLLVVPLLAAELLGTIKSVDADKYKFVVTSEDG